MRVGKRGREGRRRKGRRRIKWKMGRNSCMVRLRLRTKRWKGRKKGEEEGLK